MEQSMSYWGVMPGEILHDAELAAAGKLLYLVLSSMAHRNGFCWPSNETLAAELGLSKRRVRELLAALQERGYIRVQVRRTEDTNEVERRYIYCGMFLDREAPEPSGEEAPDPPAEDCPTSGEISPDPPAKSRSCLIGRKDIPENTPPLPPTGGKRGRRGADKPQEADVLFDRFWNAYPKKKGKEAARRAWKKLSPDMALCRVMAEALDRQRQSRDWQREEGRYIPYPASWLNGRRWEDGPDGAASIADPYGDEGEDGI